MRERVNFTTNRRPIRMVITEDAWYEVGSGNGNGRVSSIVEVEVTGQMAYVPWFEINGDDGRPIAMVNAAHVAEVRFDEEPSLEGGAQGAGGQGARE